MYEFNRSTKPRLRLGGCPCQVLTARLNTFTSGPTWKRRGVQRTGICHMYILRALWGRSGPSKGAQGRIKRPRLAPKIGALPTILQPMTMLAPTQKSRCTVA